MKEKHIGKPQKEFVKARDCNYRNGEYREGERFLWETQTELLKEIDQICRKHNTSVKIIISPDYNQISINPADVEILKDILAMKTYSISVVSMNIRTIFITTTKEDITDRYSEHAYYKKYMQTITDLKYILKVTTYYAKLFL